MSLNDDQLDSTEPARLPMTESAAEFDALQVEPTDKATIGLIADDEAEAVEDAADEVLDAETMDSNEEVVAGDVSTSAPDIEAVAAPAEEPPVADGLAEELALDEESAVDELIASYQSHMLDEEPELEFVAHVEAKLASPVVVPVSAPAVAETAQEVEAIEEPVPVIPPQSVILDLASCPVARSVQAESVPLSDEELNGQDENKEEEHEDEESYELSSVGSALRAQTVSEPEEVHGPDPTVVAIDEPDVEEPVAEWQPMPVAQPAPVVPVVAYARQLLVETPDEELSPLGFDDEATDAGEWQEDVEAAAAVSTDQSADDSAQDASDDQYEEDEVQEADDEEPAALIDPDDDESDADLEPAGTGGGWTLPLLCIGIAIIACCMVIPQADANRRLAYERAVLRADLESIQTQVATNDEFLRKLASDPALAERLAQRQLNLQRAGTKVLPIRTGDSGTSPFDLVQVPKPPKMEPYEPVGGTIAAICRDTRARLYTMGVGLFILAAGLVLGFSPNPRSRD